MGSDDLTLRVLVEIREEVRGTNQRLDRVEQRLDRVEGRLDRVEQRLDRVEGRGDELEHGMTAVTSALVAMHETMKEVVVVMKGRRRLEARVETCEHEIDVLKRRLG